MFSSTLLGNFLFDLFHKNSNELDLEKNTYVIISLLLADLELANSNAKQLVLNQYLDRIYGDSGVPKLYENVPDSDNIMEKLQGFAHESLSWNMNKVSAYLFGIINRPISIIGTSLTDIQSQTIYRRQKRIFHSEFPCIDGKDKENLIVCILGYKGSGKSRILQELASLGYPVLEVYKVFNHMRSVSLVPRDFPAPKSWRNQVLKLIFEYNNYHIDQPPILFLGSLLRLEEIEYLSDFGKVICTHVQSDNVVRHERARMRGREIEKDADHLKLIRLDAHRTGLWPEYEINDVDGLISKCVIHFENNKQESIGSIAKDILSYIFSL